MVWMISDELFNFTYEFNVSIEPTIYIVKVLGVV